MEQLMPGLNMPIYRSNAAELEKKRGEYATRYGISESNLDGFQMRQIEQAERQLVKCLSCNGQCPFRYMEPVIGEPLMVGYDVVTWRVCKWGIRRKIEKLCARWKLPRRFLDKTFADYEITAANKSAVGLAKYFITNGGAGRWIYYYGTTGTGKTFLATLIARAFVANLKEVVFGTVPVLLDEIKKTFDQKEGERKDIIGFYGRCNLLILDDMGVSKPSEWNVSALYQIIDARYNRNLPTIITSNYSLEELEARLTVGDKWSAQRIISRLSEMCEVQSLGDKDLRRKRK